VELLRAIYKLICLGSCSGLFYLILGGLFIINPISSVGMASEIGNLKKEVSGNPDPLLEPLSANVESSDTTRIPELLPEASFTGISTKLSPSLRTDKVKVENKRQVDRKTNTTDFEIQGSISIYRSEKELSRVINKNNRAIEDCYKKESKSNPNLKGDLDVEFTIDFNGRVKDIQIVRSSIYNKTIEKCITNRIRGWRFKAIDRQEEDIKIKQKYIFG